MRLIKNPKFGEYVLLHRWGDRSMYDPWRIGFLEMIAVFHGKKYYRVRGDKRWYPYCTRITAMEGKARIEFQIGRGSPEFEEE